MHGCGECQKCPQHGKQHSWTNTVRVCLKEADIWKRVIHLIMLRLSPRFRRSAERVYSCCHSVLSLLGELTEFQMLDVAGVVPSRGLNIIGIGDYLFGEELHRKLLNTVQTHEQKAARCRRGFEPPHGFLKFSQNLLHLLLTHSIRSVASIDWQISPH